MKNYLSLVLFLSIAACGDTGSIGQSGSSGIQGEPGKNADPVALDLARFVSDTSVCTSGSGVIIKAYQGAVVTSQAIVCDGTPGADAPVSPLNITELIDPCGNTPGIYDEVLLRTNSGQIIASFSDNMNGNNTRLSVLEAGSFITTDGSNCHFSVDSLGNVTW